MNIHVFLMCKTMQIHHTVVKKQGLARLQQIYEKSSTSCPKMGPTSMTNPSNNQSGKRSEQNNETSMTNQPGTVQRVSGVHLAFDRAAAGVPTQQERRIVFTARQPYQRKDPDTLMGQGPANIGKFLMFIDCHQKCSTRQVTPKGSEQHRLPPLASWRRLWPRIRQWSL